MGEYVGGYRIIHDTNVGEIGFAIGHSETSQTPYATWQRKGGDYFWGHYYKAKKRAESDYKKRIAYYKKIVFGEQER